MATRTVAEKMGLRAGWRSHLVGAPTATVAAMDLPDLDLVDALPPEPAGGLDYLHLFVVTQEQMRARFTALVPHVAPHGKLWVSWPKGRGLGSDLTLPTVIAIGYDAGMVYANSFGTLPGR